MSEISKAQKKYDKLCRNFNIMINYRDFYGKSSSWSEMNSYFKKANKAKNDLKKYILNNNIPTFCDIDDSISEMTSKIDDTRFFLDSEKSLLRKVASGAWRIARPFIPIPWLSSEEN